MSRNESRGVTNVSTESDQQFGAELYSELRRLGGHAIATWMFNYEGIQKLKVADRAEVVRLFTGRLSYAALQRLKTESATETAKYWVTQAAIAQAAQGGRFQLAWTIF